MAERILRVWRGYGSAQGVKRYADEYFAQTLLPELRALRGFVGATVLVRSDATESQLVVQTIWDSIHAIRAFAGEDVERAVVEPIVSEMLTRFDDRAAHYTIALSA